MKRDFNEWFGTFRDSIADYKYYISLDNVYMNADKYKVELNILNSLIGSSNVKRDFVILLRKYPEILKAIPILLAKREMDIYCQDSNGSVNYKFDKQNCSIEQYCYFMEETGLFDLISKKLVANLYDYVLGVNTGLDSNGRKNRGGHLMENLFESYLIKSNVDYYKEMWSDEIESKFSIDLSSITNNGSTNKRFDFVIKGKTTIYGIECNFYSGGGSKLNETARSYKMIAEESKGIENWKFVWFTDGKGWTTAKNNLKETFDILEDIYNIHDLENTDLKFLFK